MCVKLKYIDILPFGIYGLPGRDYYTISRVAHTLTLLLVFPQAYNHLLFQALVECDGDSIDLSGDIGAVGRIVISNGPTGNHDLLLDLKGTARLLSLLCKHVCTLFDFCFSLVLSVLTDKLFENCFSLQCSKRFNIFFLAVLIQEQCTNQLQCHPGHFVL